MYHSHMLCIEYHHIDCAANLSLGVKGRIQCACGGGTGTVCCTDEVERRPQGGSLLES